jgi:hypothetical protein
MAEERANERSIQSNDQIVRSLEAEEKIRWRRQQKVIITLVVGLTIAGGIAIAVVSLVPLGEINHGAGSSPQRLVNADATMAPTLSPIPTSPPSATPTIAPTESPTSAPTMAPTESPTSAPTPMTLGCRGDRFDNEGNSEKNNRLYSGQFVCSDDEGQRYHFGLDPDSADLIWYDTFTDHKKTYYTNENAFIDGCTDNSSQGICVMDYFFSLNTKGAFRIHRVERQGFDSETNEPIEVEVLHWELDSNYNISTVYENCLKTHDCPYLHLHQDGVIVLAWLDFVLSPWDGWMEKNIRRCYDFPTTDVLRR